MINPEHKLSVTKQAKALGISRGSVYYLPRPVSDRDQTLMNHIDRLHLEFPFAGARMLRDLPTDTVPFDHILIFNASSASSIGMT